MLFDFSPGVWAGTCSTQYPVPRLAVPPTPPNVESQTATLSCRSAPHRPNTKHSKRELHAGASALPPPRRSRGGPHPQPGLWTWRWGQCRHRCRAFPAYSSTAHAAREGTHHGARGDPRAVAALGPPARHSPTPTARGRRSVRHDTPARQAQDTPTPALAGGATTSHQWRPLRRPPAASQR